MLETPARGNVFQIRRIRVLLASDDVRYAGVAHFLLTRRGLRVELISTGDVIPETCLKDADVLVIDVSGAPDEIAASVSAVEEQHPALGIVVVAEEEDESLARHPQLSKWTALDELAGEIEHVYSTAHARKTSVRRVP